MKISWCVFLVSLPSVLPFGIFGGYVQLLFRWRDGTVSYFPPKNGCNFYQGCYPEYQRLPNGWPLFDKPIAPNIVFREPSFRPWTKIDTILFPAVAHNPATPSTTTETSTTEALPEIPVRSLIPDFLTTKADEENVIKGGRKGQPTTPPPILRPTTPTPANTPKFTPPPPIVRRPTTPKESPAVNNIDEEVPPKRYTPPPPIQRPTRPTKAADEGGIAAAGYAFVAEDFSTTTTRPSKTIGGRPLISWEQNRFPMPRTTRRPTPRRRTTNVPPTTTEPTTQSNTKVPKDGGRVFIEHWTKTHERTSPKPIYNN